MVAPSTGALEVPHEVAASVCLECVELGFEELACSLDQRLVPIFDVDVGRALAAVDPADVASDSRAIGVGADVGGGAEFANDHRQVGRRRQQLS